MHILPCVINYGSIPFTYIYINGDIHIAIKKKKNKKLNSISERLSTSFV